MKILKFYSETCVPCRQMIPVLNKVADELDIEVEEVDTGEDALKTAEYDIQNLPTFVMLNDEGESVGRLVGASPFPIFSEKVKGIYGLV